jgi:hypothetical protein
MKTIETITDIEAPAEIVWSTVTDFARYPDWNPFIIELDGQAEAGSRLRATFALSGRRTRTFTPVVVVLEPGRRLEWRGRLAVPKLFDAHHILSVESRDGGCRFVQREHFRGLLVPMLGQMLAATHDAFGAMGDALADHVAALGAACSATRSPSPSGARDYGPPATARPRPSFGRGRQGVGPHT